MKENEDDKIDVQVGGRGKCKTLQITCDAETMTELARLVYTKLQNVEAKPVPPHEVSEIILMRQSPADTAQQTIEDRFWMFGCLFGVVIVCCMIILMIIGAGTVGDWLFGG
jgi:hypothetical protein